MIKYYPILVSKNGEIGALQHLEQRIKDEICPVFEVIDSTFIKYKTIKETDVEPEKKIMFYSDKFEKFLRTHWSFFNNQIILDFSLFKEFDVHKDYILQTLVRLLNSGVNIIPSVQTNSIKGYKDVIIKLNQTHNCNLCFRFSNSSGGFIHMNNDIEVLKNEYSVKIENSILLLDLGQIEAVNYNTIGSAAGVVLMNLKYNLKQFKSLVLAASSFPATLGNFVPTESAHTIVRYEWGLYNNVAKGDLKIVKYGDYGTKSAEFQEVNYMGSISLKYSTAKEFVIFRGQRTTDHILGHSQFIAHAKKLIKTPHYDGKEFSWGDLRYYEIGQENLETGSTGNSTQWVQFSQNHHITLMHSIL